MSLSQIQIPETTAGQLRAVLPFWMTLLLVPLASLGALQGGWTVLLLLPLTTWYFFTLLDALLGLNEANSDPETDPDRLTWYRAITLIWPGLQFLTLFGMIWYVPQADHLSALEKIVLFFGVA